MNNFKRLLVAFDGSDDSVNALQTAASLSKQLDASITVAHVYNETASAISPDAVRPYPANTAYLADGMNNYPITPAVDEDPARNARSEDDPEYTGGHSTEVTVQAQNILEENMCSGEVKVLDGEPAEAIALYADEIKADMIIMGSRHISGLKKLFSESVSEKVTKNAKVPVMII
ncbi:universal stress protein [Metabacillus sp. GX 13764]|uniref:universal stress protein n=1 Tax=Metabacillus kandeliae TaxID=2900151 RepID=UPI001E332070|nr:universal stress protein [Metabacillus kandeliae]MCD7034813.1 universal stress protein [Metabacillus kandeliae]